MTSDVSKYYYFVILVILKVFKLLLFQTFLSLYIPWVNMVQTIFQKRTIFKKLGVMPIFPNYTQRSPILAFVQTECHKIGRFVFKTGKMESFLKTLTPLNDLYLNHILELLLKQPVPPIYYIATSGVKRF